MKKIIIIASVLVTALVSCARINSERPASEIMFQVARHSVATKADPADYKDAYQGIPFGTYSWYKALNEQYNAPYMTNQKVAYSESNNSWMTVGTTYYWPATGALDFISYSPYSEDGTAAPAPVVTENSISWSTPWNVDENQSVDVMYADKVTGVNGNVNTFNHGYEGVPTLFRHALARVAFQIKASTTKMVAAGGEITRWEIDLKSLQLNNIFTTGTLALNLADDGSWTKPETNAWTPTGTTIRRKVDISDFNTLTVEPQATEPLFVLPQTLEDQTLSVVVDVRTYRDKGDGTGEKLIITESDVVCYAALKTEELDTWGINQSITYIVTISPVFDINGEYSYILFDPATVDWDEKVVETTILI